MTGQAAIISAPFQRNTGRNDHHEPDDFEPDRLNVELVTQPPNRADDQPDQQDRDQHHPLIPNICHYCAAVSRRIMDGSSIFDRSRPWLREISDWSSASSTN